MNRRILVNSAIGETRFALLEQDQPVEIRLFRDSAPSYVGGIYLGRVRRLNREMQAAFVELDSRVGGGLMGFLPLDLLPKIPGKKPKDLTTLLQEGQEIMVQVTQDAREDKLLKLTGRLEVRASSVVLHPLRAGAFVSSRIKDPERRAALKAFGNSLDLGGMGITFRTEAENIPEKQLARTVQNLLDHWRRVTAEKHHAPCLLSQGPDPVLQILRDYGSPTLEELVFDHPAALKKAQAWTGEFAPDLTGRLRLHQGEEALFSQYGVEEELEQLFDKKIPLPSGAWITIEETEALTVIDVNMGEAAFSTDKDRQILEVNKQAAREIFRQLRLRGIGGLVVVDFINMSGKGDVTTLLKIVDSLILKDPQQVQRSNISAFGLMELTRKATYRPLTAQMAAPRQVLPSPETEALTLLRRAEQDARHRPGLELRLKGSAAALDWLGRHQHLLQEFTRRSGSPLTLEKE